MKRYLLFIISMLCVSIGAWADAIVTWDEATQTATVTSTSSDGYFPWNQYWQTLRPNVVFTGNFSNINWTDAASKVNNGNQTNARFDMSGATGITCENIATLITSQQYNNLDNVTRFVLPTGTAIPSDVSGFNHGGKLKYIYTTDGSGQRKAYLTSNVTGGSDLSSEFTSAEIEAIKTNGIYLSGDQTAISTIRTYLESQEVSSDKITQPYDGTATAVGGSVQTDVESDYTAGAGTAAEVTTLTVSSGTLLDADVTYITGNLTYLTSLDISGATATAEQIYNLLSGTPAGCTVTLSDAQKTLLKSVSDKTVTSAQLSKAGISATTFMNGMTTKNFIISGTTLYVTGNLESSDASAIKTILEGNSSITTLDVSKCTNSSGTVNITDADYLSSSVTAVCIPKGEYITYSGSKTKVNAGSLTIDIPTNYETIADAVANTDLQALVTGNGVDHLVVTGMLTSTDLANLHNLGSGTGFSSVESINVSAVTLSSGAWTDIAQNNADWGNATVLMPRGTDVSSFENCMANIQSISADGQTLSIQVNNADNVNKGMKDASNSGASKLVVYDGCSNASDKQAAGSTAIAALATVNGISVLDMTHATDQGESLSSLTNFNTVLSPVSATGKLTVLGSQLTNEMLQTISSLTNTITSVDFSGVTSVASDLDWNNLTASASLSDLASLTLPKGTELTTAEARKLTTNFSSLMYAYSPTTKNRTRAEQDVADYVYVIRPGGLNQAMTDESDLRKAVYVKIVSDVGNNVALSTTDANFGGHGITSETSYISGGDDYPWQFIDLSGTIVTAAATSANTAPYTDKGYRIILPSNLTGDNMAIFASKPITDDGKGRGYRGIPAAVYSYKGTTLNILEIADESYLTNALKDDRIVRDGTTEVSVISGVFGSNTYFNFGDNLRQAINGAKDCVETVTIEVPYSGGATLTIDNDHLKTVSMEGVSNSTVALDVDGCATLETLNLSEATFSKATAQDITTLKEVDLRNTTFSGEKNTSTGEGCINLTNSLHNELEITYVTGFDTGRIIPAAASDYFNAIAQANLDVSCAGSTLESNMPAVLTAKEVTDGKDSGTYRNRDITVLHVTGTLTSADINFIVNNLTRLELLDLKGASYGDGVSGETLVNALYGNGMSDIALIFPTNNTKASEGAGTVNQHEVWYATTLPYQMKCVGYFADEDEYKTDLHVFGTDENVGKLAAIVPDSGDDLFYQFSVTFEPKYQSDPALGYNAAISAGTYNWGVYPNATDKFVSEGLSRLPANTIDLTFMNISTVKNLASLNENTHFVVVPTTGQYFNDSEDVTKTGTDDGATKYYHFPNSVYGISTLKGSTWPLSSSCRFNGRNYDFSTTGPIGRALLTYITPSGEGNITETVGEFINSNLPAIDRYVGAGTFDNNAITALQHITAKEMDLSGATVTDENMLAFRNTTVEYLALPDGKNALINASKVDAMDDASFNFKALTSLKAIGAYDSSNDDDDTTLPTYTVHSTANTVTATDPLTQENSVYKITSMCAPNASRTAGSAEGMEKVVMSGYLTLDDIQVGTPQTANQAGLASDGSIKEADLSNAVFLNNEDMTFTGACWTLGTLTSITLPTDTRQNTIPHDCLNNFANLQEICIPYNYEYINKAAFYLAGLRHVTTTDANGALVDKGEDTFTFSKNLKAIGEKPTGSGITDGKDASGIPVAMDYPVFFSEGIHHLKDVYALRTGYEDGGSECQPTKCYRGAFGAGPTYGWNGFDGGNVYCREKYLNGDQLFTVLHYPDRASVSSYTSSPVMPAPLTSSRRTLGSDSYTEMEKLYTDPTKVYTKKDQTGAVDANGESPLWPTHSELGRSWNQAVRGLIWYDWNIDEEKQAQGNINGGVITATPDDPSDVEKVSNSDHYEFTDYVGWHEFVLSLATYVAPDEKVVDNEVIRTYEEDDWYTFCIPFDMTEQEVALLLGIPRSTDEDPGTDIKIVNNLKTPDSKGNLAGKVTENIMPTIVTLKQVTRNSSTNTVSLSCSLDMGSGANKFKYYSPSANNYIPNGYVDLDGDSGEDEDEKIMIRAGYPYIIRPYTLCDPETGVRNAVPSNNLGKQILTRYAFKMIASAINHSDTREAIGGEKTHETSDFAKPYEGHKVQAYSDAEPMAPLYRDAPTNAKPYNYTFVGQYWTQYLPQNCFYMSGHKWYHNTYPREEGYYWYPYTCLILTSNEDESGLFRYDTDNTKYGETNYDYTIIPEETGEDKDGHAVFDKQMQIRFKDGFDDSFTSNARVYHFVFDEDIMDFDEDGQTTGIDVLDGQHVAPVRGEVYNMAGQHVGNSLNGLPKGMYIVNGKKIVIR